MGGFGNRSIYGALKVFYLAQLLSKMKVQELTNGSVNSLVLVDRLYVENSGKLSDITGVVTVTVGIARSPNRTTKIAVVIKRIMRIAHLVPETAEIDNKRW